MHRLLGNEWNKKQLIKYDKKMEQSKIEFEGKKNHNDCDHPVCIKCVIFNKSYMHVHALILC